MGTGASSGAGFPRTALPALMEVCGTEPRGRFRRRGGMVLSETKSKQKELKFFAF